MNPLNHDNFLKERTILVTGGSRGLGLGCAQQLARRGARVVLASRSAESVERAVHDVRGRGGLADGLELDWGSEMSIDGVADHVDTHYGGVDAVVCSGGGPPNGGVLDIDQETERVWFQSLFWGPSRLVRRLLPHMVEQGFGRVVLVGSRTVREPEPKLALSNVPRAALWAWARGLATEVAGAGVTVNMLLPGLHATDRVRERMSSAEQLERRMDGIPVRKLGSPESFGEVATLLCGPAGDFITGSTLTIDGGESHGLF